MIRPARLVAVLVSTTLFAQTNDRGTVQIQLAPGTVGVPYDQAIEPPGGGQGDGNPATVAFGAPSGLPPGLAAALGRIRGVPSQAGDFRVRIPGTITCKTCHGKTFVQTMTVEGAMKITGAPGGLLIETGALQFTFPEGSRQPLTQQIRITNRGSQTRTLTASLSESRPWLSIAGGGSAGPFSTATIPVTVNPAGLAAGFYPGLVRISAPGGTESFSAPVLATVTPASAGLIVSQSGLTFEAEQGSTAALAQVIHVGGGTAFTVAAGTVSGGGWLQAAAAGNAVTVRANAQGLPAGQYFGQVEVRADTPDSPRTVTVLLNVAAAAGTLAPQVSPAGLILVQRPGAATPPAVITVTNASAREAAISMSTAFEGSVEWFTPRVQAPAVAPGAAVSVQVVRDPAAAVPPGVHQAELILRFAGSVRRVAVVLVALPPGSTAPRGARLAEGCTPTRLVPVFTTLGSGFAVNASWPSALELLVADDCGDPLIQGSAAVTFSNGDPPLPLVSAGGGRWAGTWQPRAGAQNVVLAAAVESASVPQLMGTVQIGGAANQGLAIPQISAGGVLSAASFQPLTPVAPGSYVAVFGKGMAAGLSSSPALPLSAELGGTQAVLAGRRLPLQFTSDGQINAVIPYDVPVNVVQQLVVRHGTRMSAPEPVVVAAAQPAIFTKNQTGSGEGIIVAVQSGGTQFLAGAESPAAPGDVLVIYCAGLGAVTPAAAAGAAGPSSPLSSVVNPVTVVIGGKTAQVLFAGLAPGFAGIYQVNVVVPEGLEAGTAQVVLSAAGQASNAATVAIGSAR
ncbi:MAG: hypothetical protein FJW39_15355 [Acidobacteria bacterium]|nr:hypothetical protein [Acidobacteriota bacterium]